METTVGDGDRGTRFVKRTTSIIFFNALRSLSHLRNAPRSFCLFFATESRSVGTDLWSRRGGGAAVRPCAAMVRI
ncbi:hypothetical protein ACSQ67_003224 [Phaseolus vulgaris]